MKLVDQPETRSDKVPKSLKKFAGRGGVMFDFTTFMLAKGMGSRELQERIQQMFNVARSKNPPPKMVEYYLPGIGQFINEKDLNMKNYI